MLQNISIIHGTTWWQKLAAGLSCLVFLANSTCLGSLGSIGTIRLILIGCPTNQGTKESKATVNVAAIFTNEPYTEIFDSGENVGLSRAEDKMWQKVLHLRLQN
jgi:hypothetical protein